MKKGFALLLAVTLCALCAGCGGADKQTAAETEVTANVTEAAASIDIDLTEMSSTMVYSEVANIMATPENYIGKTLRVKGPFKQNQGYYFVLISDATACCAQGLEFIWAGDHTFPNDYPAVDTEVVVTGTFESYMEGEKKYYHINNASLETA